MPRFELEWLNDYLESRRLEHETKMGAVVPQVEGFRKETELHKETGLSTFLQWAALIAIFLFVSFFAIGWIIFSQGNAGAGTAIMVVAAGLTIATIYATTRELKSFEFRFGTRKDR